MLAKVLNLKKRINDRNIIDNISFELEEGTINVILGPNGVGKTTTIRLLTGLLKCDAGKVEVLGKNVEDRNFDSVRTFIGVQNDGNLYENLTIIDNLNIWADFYDMSESCRDKNIEELLNLFDMSERKYSKVGTLSKGMKQKVLIVRALIHEPKLLILDEPTSGLDPSSAELLIKYIKKIVQEKGTTVFMCTHHLYGIEEVADKVYIMNDGRFIASGHPENLLQQEWQYHEFDIETSDGKEATDVLKNMYEVHLNSQMLRVQLKNYKEISNIISMLLDKKINVFAVIPVKHTIKELYFKKIGDFNEYKN